MIDRASKTREEIFGAIRSFTAATIAEAEQATDAIIRIVNNAAPSPSPAPGVVGLWNIEPNIGASTDEPSLREIVTSYYRGHFTDRKAKEIAGQYLSALASISQPAKGELQEAAARTYLDAIPAPKGGA